MKENEERKANVNGDQARPLKTLLVVSLIAAFIFAALPMSSVFAAPTGPGGSGGTNNNNDSWQSKVQKLRAEISISNNFQTQPGKFCGSAQDAKYRDAYMSTLRAAETLIKSDGSVSVIPVTGNSSNGTSANGNATTNGNNNSIAGLFMVKGRGGYYAQHPEKLLAAYLHRMRMLRDKMSGNNNASSNNNGNSNNGNQNSCFFNNTNNGTGTSTGTGTGTGTSTGTGTGTTATPAPNATPSATPTP